MACSVQPTFPLLFNNLDIKKLNKLQKNWVQKLVIKYWSNWHYVNKGPEVWIDYVTHYVNEFWNLERMLNSKFETNKKTIW